MFNEEQRTTNPDGQVGIPICHRDKEQMVYDLLSDYLNKKKCLFFRIEPDTKLQTTSYPDGQVGIPSLPRDKLQATKDINPRVTTLLNLERLEDELLVGMHQKTRYNIRVAAKQGVMVREEKNTELLMKLLKKTGQRDGFTLHGRAHYEHVLNSPLTYQLTAYQGAVQLATAVFVGFGDCFTYLYGASDYAYRALMAPYAIQWRGILLARRLGYKQYDTFGIAPTLVKSQKSKVKSPSEYVYDLNHQYAGVTRFKLGFSGIPVERPGTYDLILQPGKYRMYQILRAVRRIFLVLVV